MGRDAVGSIDFAFLSTQTFADEALECEVLELYVAQIHKMLPGLDRLAPTRQADVAHLLAGSSRGIGAWAAADAAQLYGALEPHARHAASADLTRALDAARAAAEDRIAALRR